MDKGARALSTSQVEVVHAGPNRTAGEMVRHPTSLDIQEKVKDLHTKLKEKLVAKESDIRQTSTVNCLKLGASNTKFFRLTTKIRRSYNYTLRLLSRSVAPCTTEN